MKHKLLVSVAAAAVTFGGVCAYAQVGDIEGTIYTTDILTQVDGRDITGYAIDGRTLIALEDLEDYGFTVYYNDNIRCVFLTKTGEAASDFKPCIGRGTVGAEAGYYYETDIRAFVNGEEVSAYAIDGKMVACVEELGAKENIDVQNGIIKENKYQMGYSYDDSQRLLSLDTELTHYGSFNELTSMMLDVTTPWRPYSTSVADNGNNWIAVKKMGGLPHGQSMKQYNISYKSGLCFNAYPILRAYYLTMSSPVFSEDGTKIYFKNYPDTDYSYSTAEYKQMELNSMNIYPLTESEYERAASLIKRSDRDIIVSGVTAPMYSIGGRDYIRAADLKKCGFTVTENSDVIEAAYSGTSKGTSSVNVLSVSGNAARSGIADLRINGSSIDMSDSEPIYTYNGSSFIPLSCFEYYYAYDTDTEEMRYRYDIPAGKVYLGYGN